MQHYYLCKVKSCLLASLLAMIIIWLLSKNGCIVYGICCDLKGVGKPLLCISVVTLARHMTRSSS